jgi:uncharacterized membrane protein YfcA
MSTDIFGQVVHVLLTIICILCTIVILVGLTAVGNQDRNTFVQILVGWVIGFILALMLFGIKW